MTPGPTFAQSVASPASGQSTHEDSARGDVRVLKVPAGQTHIASLEAPATEVVPSGHAVHWSGKVRSVDSPYVPGKQSKAHPTKLKLILPVPIIHLPRGQT